MKRDREKEKGKLKPLKKRKRTEGRTQGSRWEGKQEIRGAGDKRNRWKGEQESRGAVGRGGGEKGRRWEGERERRSAVGR